MAPTRSRSRGREQARPSSGGVAAEHSTKIYTVATTAIIVIIAFLALTSVGHVIDAATQHFMLFYAGVFALIGLCGSVVLGLVATDRMFLNPAHRVFMQSAHRAASFGAVTFLIIHIITEILAQRVHVLDAVVPFLSPFRTFYIGLGTISSDLVILLVITGILRGRFNASGKAWRWRAIHYTSYVSFVFGVWHGLLGGRPGKPYVDWSYGFLVAVVLLALAVRVFSDSLRPKENLSGPPVHESAGSASAPMRAMAMFAQLAAARGNSHGPTAVSGGQPVLSAPVLTALPAGTPGAGTGQPYYEPGYEGPPRYLGAPRATGTGPMPQARTGPMARVHTGPMPRVDTGPLPPYATGPMPAAPAGPRPPYLSGPMPAVNAGPPPYASGPMPRIPTGPMPQPSNGPLPPYAGGQAPGFPTGPMPVADAGAFPPYAGGPSRFPTGPMPVAETGPFPPYASGPGPVPRFPTGPMPLAGMGPVPPSTISGPLPVPPYAGGQVPPYAGGQVPRFPTGPMPVADTGAFPPYVGGPSRFPTGPMPVADAGAFPPYAGGPSRFPTGPMPVADAGAFPPYASGPLPGAPGGPVAGPRQQFRPATGPMPPAAAGRLPQPGDDWDAGMQGRPPASHMQRPAGGPPPRGGSGPMPGQHGYRPRPGTGPVPQAGPAMPPPARPDGGGWPAHTGWQAAGHDGSRYPAEPPWDGLQETDPNLRYREPGPGMPGYRGSREHRYGGDAR